jgi:hypothetical protein
VLLRDVVHSKNFDDDDGAVVHRHPLCDSTRETNTTPRKNSEKKKTKRRRTSSSSSSSSLPLSLSRFSLSLSSSSSSLWWCLLSFFRFLEKISTPKPKRRRRSKNVGVFCGHKNVSHSFSQKGIVERDLSLFFKSFLCSLQDLYVRVRSRQKKKKRERVLVCNVWILVSKKKSKNREERERERTLSCVTTTSRKRDSSILSTP